jgi:hypothetical protein
MAIPAAGILACSLPIITHSGELDSQCHEFRLRHRQISFQVSLDVE